VKIVFLVLPKNKNIPNMMTTYKVNPRHSTFKISLEHSTTKYPSDGENGRNDRY
jgi:hypothetical protein